MNPEREQIKASFTAQEPFKFVMFEDFLRPDMAEIIFDNYPTIENGIWDGTTYIDQKNKFQKSKFVPGTEFDTLFKELNSPRFLEWLEYISGIDALIGDEELFGGGLHQSIRGAFLNVHVDYNIHPKNEIS